MRLRSAVARLLSCFLCILASMPAFSNPVFAAPMAQPKTASPRTLNLNKTGSASTLNLNLLSSAATVTAPARVFGKATSAAINVGGINTTIVAGSQITPAEFVALTQVLKSGSQSLTLNSAGSATGGTFSLNSLSHFVLTSLTIPANVVAIDKASSTPTLITGLLTTDGTLLGIAGSGRALDLTASSITVGTGGSITTVLSPSLLGSIPAGTLKVPVDLSLFSLGNIANAGTISASGQLSLSSAGAIINSLPTGIAGAAPQISGMQGVQLTSNVGQFTNAGIISSTNGSVSFNAPAGVNLMLANATGLVSANQGAINFHTPNYSASDLTSVAGGLLSAQSVNFFGGNGDVKAIVDQINGQVNITGGTANVLVSQGTLDLGTMNLSGDPTIVNSSSTSDGGNVVLSSGFTFTGQDLAILATGNVTSTLTTKQTINLAGKTGVNNGNGGNLTIVAGYTITPDSGGQQTDNTTPYVLDGTGSTAGGMVSLPNFVINTGTTVKGSTAGNVTIVAQGTSGAISIGAISANATGGTAGSVLLCAPDSVSVAGAINASGAKGGGVTVSASTPTLTGGSITFLNGTASGGTFGAGAPVDGAGGTVSTLGILASGGTLGGGGAILVQAPSNITITGAVTTKGGTGTNAGTVTMNSLDSYISATGAITSSGGAGAVSLQASSYVNVVGAIVTTGGAGLDGAAVTLNSSDSYVNVKGAITTLGGAGADGGAVILDALSSYVNVTGTINASGGKAATTSAGGGSSANVSFSAMNNIQLGGSVIADGGADSNKSGNGGAGGTITFTTGTNTDGANPTNLNIGQINIKGSLDTRGGAATGGTGGDGGTVTNMPGGSAYIIVLGATAGGGSINVSAGLGKTASGNPGAVNIATNGIQTIPTVFDLTSATQNIVAIPGGYFTIGSAVGNGTAGKIINGATVLSSTTPGITPTTPLNTGGIQIATADDTYTIQENGGGRIFSSQSTLGGKMVRTFVTPGEALALYQVSITTNPATTAQTLGLNAQGQVVDTITQLAVTSTSSITIYAPDFPIAFTTFNVASLPTSSTTGNLVSVIATGTNVNINMPLKSTATIAATLEDLDTAGVMNMNLSSKPLTVTSTGFILGDNTIQNPSTNPTIDTLSTVNIVNVTSGTLTLNNSGTIEVPTINISNKLGSVAINMSTFAPFSPSTAFIGFNNPNTLEVQGVTNVISSDKTVTEKGGEFTWTTLNISTVGSTGNGANITMTNMSFGNPSIPNDTDSAGLGTINAGIKGSVSISSPGNIWSPLGALDGSGVVIQQLPITNMTAKSITIVDTDFLVGTEISLVGNFTATGGNLTIEAAETTTTGSGVILMGDVVLFYLPSGSTFKSTSGSVNIAAGLVDIGGTVSTPKGSINVSGLGSTLVGDGEVDLGDMVATTFTAGTLVAGTVTSTVLPPGSVLNAGSINVIATGSGSILQLGLEGAVTLTANGGNVLIGAAGDTGSSISLDTAGISTLQANGGNVLVLSSGTVEAGTGNSFTANAIGTTKSFTGGGIQVSSGSLTNSVTALLKKISTPILQLPDSGTISTDGFNTPSGPTGVISVSSTGGGIINMNSDTAHPQGSSANMSGGAIFIQSVGSAGSVTGTGDTFNTATPIGFSDHKNQIESEQLVDTGDVDLDEELVESKI